MIKSFLSYVLYQKRYSKNTVVAYRRDLLRFEEFVGGEEQLLTASRTDVRAWLLQLLEEGMAESSVHRKMSSLSSFYKYLLKIGTVNANPVLEVSLPKQPRRLPVFLKESQTDHLFTKVMFEDSFEGVRDRLILQLFYETGMRVSEMAELKTAAIDCKRNILKVLGKRNKERIIPILPNMSEHILDYVAIRNKEIGQNLQLLVSRKNTPLNRGQLYRIVKKYLSQVSTALKCSPHVLRHTFATQLMNNGADVNALKELLGHSSLAATQVYTHSTKEQLKKDYKQAHPRA